MRFKKGSKVKPKENHEYLGLSKRNIGIVVENLDRKSTNVYFKCIDKKIIFCSYELRKI